MDPLGAYRSNGPTPCLEEFLACSRNYIEIQFELRVTPRNFGSTFSEEWNTICDILTLHPSEDGAMNATQMDRSACFHEMLASTVPDTCVLIRVAMALCVEAHLARDNNEMEQAWAALVRCNYYIGKCSGAESLTERSARGGRHSSPKKVDRLRTMVLTMLSGMGNKSQPRKQDVWNLVVPEMAAFKPGGSADLARAGSTGREQSRTGRKSAGSLDKVQLGRSSNPRQLLQRWTNHDPEIKKEFERIVIADLNTGGAGPKKIHRER